MNEQKDSTSKGVSEAAPERLWLFQMAGMDGRWVSTESESAKANYGVEYARVHQPPEQNSEDKNSVSPKPKAPSHSSVVIPESVSLDADRRIAAMKAHIRRTIYRHAGVLSHRVNSLDPLEHIRLLQTAIDPGCGQGQPLDYYVRVAAWHAAKLMDATHLLGEHKDEGVYYCELCKSEFANPITQAGASASALSTTVPDESSLQHQSESSSESESTLVTVDEAARKAAEKIVNKFTIRDMGGKEQRVIKEVAEIIAAELNSVHQPDVQAADEKARQVVQEWADYVRSHGGSLGSFNSFAQSLIYRVAAALAASPVQPEVSKEQDSAKS